MESEKIKHFGFIRWVKDFNPKHLHASKDIDHGAYKIDRFITSDYYYLWVKSEKKYLEFETNLDMSDEENIKILLLSYQSTFSNTTK